MSNERPVQGGNQSEFQVTCIQTASLIERVRLQQLILLSHVPCLPENEPVREFAMYAPTHGRKKPSRQQTLFTNYIHCPLRDPDSLPNDNQLLEMAQDHH